MLLLLLWMLSVTNEIYEENAKQCIGKLCVEYNLDGRVTPFLISRLWRQRRLKSPAAGDDDIDR